MISQNLTVLVEIARTKLIIPQFWMFLHTGTIV